MAATAYQQAGNADVIALIKRGIEEHEELRGRIDRIEEGIHSMLAGSAKETMLWLRKEASQLLSEAEQHMHWEEGKLFPLLAETSREAAGPDMACTAWMMESNYKLAAELLTKFLSSTGTAALLPEDAYWAPASLALSQACSLLKEQAELEEALLFAPAMKMKS